MPSEEHPVRTTQKSISINVTLSEHDDWEEVHHAVSELIDHVPANYPMDVSVTAEVNERD